MNQRPQEYNNYYVGSYAEKNLSQNPNMNGNFSINGKIITTNNDNRPNYLNINNKNNNKNIIINNSGNNYSNNYDNSLNNNYIYSPSIQNLPVQRNSNIIDVNLSINKNSNEYHNPNDFYN